MRSTVVIACYNT